MRARIVWLTLAAAVLALVAYRGLQVWRARSGQQDETRHAPALIRTARVERTSITVRVAFNGTVRPKNEVDVYGKLPGRIESVAFEVGDRIRVGQVLAVVEHKEVAWQAKAAAAAVQLAKANYDGAKIEHDRTAALFESHVTTQSVLDNANVKLALAEAQLAQAEAASGLAAQTLANATITAPIDGVVTRKLINLGAQAAPQSPIATIQDLATLKLEGGVDGADVARLAKGAEARITVEGVAGDFPGRVSVVAPALDPVSRRATVEIEIDNTKGQLMPNMFAHTEVTIGTITDALAVPRAAVVESSGHRVVFRVQNGRAEAVRPELGPSDSEHIAVTHGLAEGDEVAVTAVSSLADGAAVKVADASAPVRN